MSQDYISHGIQLKMGDGASPENFTAVAHIGDVKGPNMAQDTVEATHHGSSAKEFLATIEDGGEISLPINWDPAEATHKNTAGGLAYAFKNKQKKNWQLVYPTANNDMLSFAAFVVGFEPSGAVAGKLTAEIKLRVTGPVTFSE